MSPETESIIRAEYPKGTRLAKIAKLCGCSVFSVCRYAKQLNIPRRRPQTRKRSAKVSLETQLAIVKARGTKDFREVAKEYGLAPITVHKIWQKWKE